jgi:hypothetical protein
VAGRLPPSWTALGVIVAHLASCAPPAVEFPGQILPARFEGDRVFLDLQVPGTTEPLTLYTDTGGGLFVLGQAADRFGIVDSAGVLLSRLTQSDFPDPRGIPGGIVPVFRPAGVHGVESDGMLGQAWFADRVWTLDYLTQRLLLHRASPPAELPGSRVPVWFRTDSTGARVLSFPRVQITVDGEVLDLLLDTGAMIALTDAAVRALDDGGPADRGTSFITTEVLTRWRNGHPEWRVIEDADRNVAGMAMIEVPEVTIGGHTVGPAWFTERPDRNFHEYMALWMDRPLDGAVGGSVFRFFALTLDYPAATAIFERSGAR